MPPRQHQQRGSNTSKPLIPHHSLPSNPMTYQPPAQAVPSMPMQQVQGYMYPMTHASTGMIMPGYGMPGMYPYDMQRYPNPFFPQMVYGQPAQTNEGYSYSSTYLAEQAAVQAQSSLTGTSYSTSRVQESIEPPSKRTRLNPNPSSQPTPTSIPTPRPPFIPTRTKIALKKGQSESAQGFWRNCSHPGCAYVGPDKEVRVHEEDRHLIVRDLSGVGGTNGNGNRNGSKGKEREDEDEEAAALKRLASTPTIPGTKITLQTEEEIARWIAERKARWPTTTRVAEKEKERAGRIERGEILPDSERGRGRGRGRGRAERGRGGERGRGRGRGRDSGYGNRVETRSLEVQVGLDETSGSSTSDPDSDSSNSNSSDSDEEPETADVHSKVAPLVAPTPPEPDDLKGKDICKAFSRTGRCKFGNKCRYTHINKPRDTAKFTTKQEQPKSFNPFSRPSLLGAMLQTPLQQTLLTISETIEFLVDNDFLDDVELRPGQAEEQAQRYRQLVVVQEDGGESSVKEQEDHEKPEEADETIVGVKEQEKDTKAEI